MLSFFRRRNVERAEVEPLTFGTAPARPPHTILSDIGTVSVVPRSGGEKRLQPPVNSRARGMGMER